MSEKGKDQDEGHTEEDFTVLKSEINCHVEAVMH